MAFLIAFGCGTGPDRTQPPDIRLGEDACDHCKMIISEIRFAAGYYDGTGTPRRFDDIGCLVAFVKTSAVPPPTIWVHAYEGDAWIRAPDASVVVNDQIHTAMGSGIVAVDSLPAAERLASNGKVELVSIDELISGTPDEQ